MGKLDPNSSEVNLLRDMFIEGAEMRGTECSITLYTTYTPGDISGVYSDPVTYDVNVFFEETPQVRTLKALNWYSEDEEILPSIIYVPAKINDVDIDIREGSKLEVKIGDRFRKEYKVSSVKAPYTYVIYFTCKLTPWFESEVRNDLEIGTDRTGLDGKFNFFDVPSK